MVEHLTDDFDMSSCIMFRLSHRANLNTALRHLTTTALLVKIYTRYDHISGGVTVSLRASLVASTS